MDYETLPTKAMTYRYYYTKQVPDTRHFFHQPGWLIDLCHTRIALLAGHTAKKSFTDLEMLHRVKMGV